MNNTKIVQRIDIEHGEVRDKFKKPFILKDKARKQGNKRNNLLNIKVVKAIKHKLYQSGKIAFGFKL